MMNVTDEQLDGASRQTLDGVLGMLRTQRGLYTELESVAARQRSLITGDDPTSLLALLAERQKLLVRMTRVARSLEPVREDWAQYKDRFDPTQRAEAQTLLGDIRERLRRVIEGDEEDARLLAARKETAAAGLRRSHDASQALNAYRAPMDTPRRVDRTDEGA